jgi:predicted phage baseplate assembly protein
LSSGLISDILTFYQERIANEAFLTTATQRDSLLRLVSLIDYQPSPGAAASGLAAFTPSKDKVLTVPAGFRVGSRALPAKPAVTFETASAITATGNSSAIPLSALSPAIPFPPGTVVLQGANNRLAAGDYILAVENQGTPNEASHPLLITGLSSGPVANTTTITWQELGGTYTQASKQAAVYALRIKAGPFGSTAPAWATSPATLTNSDGQHPGAPYTNNWDSSITWIFPSLSSPAALTRGGGQAPAALRATNPNSSLPSAASLPSDIVGIPVANPGFYIPIPDDSPNTLFLDGVYDGAKGTPQNPGWAVLLTDGQMAQALHVVDSRPTSKTAYTITSRVTRLTFQESLLPLVFPFRNTIVLTGAEPLTLQIDLPLPDSVTGKTLVLAGVQSQLQDGQTVILRGNLFDSSTNGPTGTPGAESGVLDGPPVVDTINNVTTVTLKEPLANQYVRASCVLAANVVEVTQGQTIKDEVLGSSDGSAFQSYPLKQKPLTYLPSTDPEAQTAVQSTLLVTVNSVAWNEQPTLAESAPHAQDFMLTLDDSGQTTVIFGDGINGARPPSGTNNLHARYRKGLGASGNVPTDSIQQLIDSVPGLQKVTNPLATNGGGDPETIAQIRAKAPASLQTFGRAVSAPDYAALALSYPGIAKASATYVLQDPITLQAVPHPYVQLTVASVDQVPLKGTVFAGKLRQFLDNQRDPNVDLRILDYNPVYIELAVEVEIDDHFPHQGTLAEVQAALNPGLNPDGSAGYFAFERLQFGQSVHLSALYAVVQAVPGIKDATITTLRRMGPGLVDPPSTVQNDIFLGPTEVVIFDPTDPNKGKLTITGQGGFRDT